jgi:hypothetical protein
MSADGGHLERRFGSLDIILKVDHLKTIHAMFALNCLTGFRGILDIFPISSYVKTMSADRQMIHKFSTGPPNEHSCKVTIQLA